jgi:hypothetical protein
VTCGVTVMFVADQIGSKLKPQRPRLKILRQAVRQSVGAGRIHNGSNKALENSPC